MEGDAKSKRPTAGPWLRTFPSRWKPRRRGSRKRTPSKADKRGRARQARRVNGCHIGGGWTGMRTPRKVDKPGRARRRRVHGDAHAGGEWTVGGRGRARRGVAVHSHRRRQDTHGAAAGGGGPPTSQGKRPSAQNSVSSAVTSQVSTRETVRLTKGGTGQSSLATTEAAAPCPG